MAVWYNLTMAASPGGMTMDKTYTLHIDGCAPGAMPMAHLAQYMRCFAKILGDRGVHFHGLQEGSTRLAARVEGGRTAAADERLRMVGTSEAETPAALHKACDALNKVLDKDGVTARICDGGGRKLARFAGAGRPKVKAIRPCRQEGALSGELCSIGGTGKTASLQLRAGATRYTGLKADREMAKQLGQHLFKQMRVFGQIVRSRDERGKWHLVSFRVEGFKLLRDRPMTEIIEEWREIYKKSDWAKLDDPLAELAKMRED